MSVTTLKELAQELNAKAIPLDHLPLRILNIRLSANEANALKVPLLEAYNTILREELFQRGAKVHDIEYRDVDKEAATPRPALDPTPRRAEVGLELDGHMTFAEIQNWFRGRGEKGGRLAITGMANHCEWPAFVEVGRGPHKRLQPCDGTERKNAKKFFQVTAQELPDALAKYKEECRQQRRESARSRFNIPEGSLTMNDIRKRLDISYPEAVAFLNWLDWPYEMSQPHSPNDRPARCYNVTYEAIEEGYEEYLKFGNTPDTEGGDAPSTALLNFSEDVIDESLYREREWEFGNGRRRRLTLQPPAEDTILDKDCLLTFFWGGGNSVEIFISSLAPAEQDKILLGAR